MANPSEEADTNGKWRIGGQLESCAQAAQLRAQQVSTEYSIVIGLTNMY